jgi:glycine/D-amino acid oxidase-like deaminating enzyme
MAGLGTPAGRPATTPATTPAVTADAIVIGAGVIGAAIALELARGGRRVAVVDRAGAAGHGSTSASSAIVRFNYSTRDGVATAWEARHIWARWAEHLEFADPAGLAEFHRTGLVMLDAPPVPRDRAIALFDAVGVPYEEWDAATLAERIPGIDPGRYWPPRQVADEEFFTGPAGELGGLFTPDAGFVSDPQLAAHNLAAAAASHGAELLFGRTVTGVDRDGGRVRGIRLAGGESIAAPVVVNAAGPWSSAVNKLAGVGGDFTIGVRPLRQEVHQVRAPHGYVPPGERHGPAIADLDMGTYLRSAPGGGILVGGTEPACDPMEWAEDPDAVLPHVTTASFDAQVTRAARRLTSLRVPSAPVGIVGVYDVADDWTPIYDRTDLDGFYVAMGTSGNQFKNAPLAGLFLAALIEAVESGRDHDADPVRYPCPHTGGEVSLGAFSRLRGFNAETSGTVMG